MITIKDDAGFVHIDTWQELLERPGFQEGVDPRSVVLKNVIGHYHLPSEVPCGLSSCRQGHRRGYVATTNGGVITNLGHVCGKHYFGLDFESMRKAYDREARMQSYREQIGGFKLRVHEIYASIEDLRSQERGADWVNKGVKILSAPDGLPELIRRRILEMARASDERLFVERVATEREREIGAQQRKGRSEDDDGPRYISRQVGALAGVEALREDADLRSILIVELQKGLDRIAALDLDAANERELSTEARWIADVDSKLDRAQKIVAAGVRLLDKANLSQLEQLADGDRDRAAIRAVIARCVSE